MRILVTGSSGHLGEAIMRVLADRGATAIGIDIKAGPYTTQQGSITDRDFVDRVVADVDAVIHTATLHKPHVVTHSRQDFIDINITATLNLLEAARANSISRFIFTSTTSAFGNVLRPPPAAPAVWVTETVREEPKNIYGVTKLAAENLCDLFAQKFSLPCLVLRTARFFPEEDDDAARRAAFSNDNMKVNELLNRRVDIEDAVSAHLCAIDKAPEIGFGRYIISATTPFTKDDLALLHKDAKAVVARHVDIQDVYGPRDWRMFDKIDRIYVNEAARKDLGWRPIFDFQTALTRLAKGMRPFSDLTYDVGAKGYHDEVFKDGPFPVD